MTAPEGFWDCSPEAGAARSTTWRQFVMKEKQAWIKEQEKNQLYTADLGTLIRYAVAEKKKSIVALVKEMMELSRGAGRLSPRDYFRFQLYDDERHTPESRKRFLSSSLHWPITDKCSPIEWRATTEDKWLSYRILAGFGLPVPQTQAVVDKTYRTFADDPKISTTAEMEAFLRDTARFPIFAKPNGEMGSFGAFIVTGFEDGKATFSDGRVYSCTELVDDVIGISPYLFQNTIENHEQIRKFASSTATVRTVNLVAPDRVMTPFALLKIPVGDNIADNYWRTGNLVADIDLETGELRRVVRGVGIELEELEDHPDTGDRLLGMTLPYWRELLDLNTAAARLFAPIRYQSLDICLTDSGPMIVEINSGGDTNLPQLAGARGMLTDEVKAFFESCGYKFRK